MYCSDATAGQGTVVAVSRHGLMPRVHRGDGSPGRSHWLPVFSQASGAVRFTDLMWQVRATISDHPAGWQDVVHTLRPHVPALWERLPLGDKRLFLRHVARYWEVHRHRIPPRTASRLAALRAAGRLSVHAGRVSGVSQQPGGLLARVESDGGAHDLPCGWLINATGPATNLAATSDPLLRDLLGRGLARPDPLGLGLAAGPSGALLSAKGRPSDVLFTLGPTLRGCRYETTAIPEIRDQAAALARLTSATHAPGRPVSAA
ncbi:MAG TPA: hypothetical protein VH641_16640 [Streptosporangiaceae bacterium]